MKLLEIKFYHHKKRRDENLAAHPSVSLSTKDEKTDCEGLILVTGQ